LGLGKVSIDCVWAGVSFSQCIRLGSSECIMLASIGLWRRDRYVLIQ
jgi:hypothetical protein